MVNGNQTLLYTASGLDSAKALLAAVQGSGLSEAGDAQIVKMSNPFDIFRPQVAAIIGCCSSW